MRACPAPWAYQVPTCSGSPAAPRTQAASTIAAEVDALKQENAELLARRAALEEETRGAHAELAGTQHLAAAAQAELDSMRRQADIWRSTSSSETDKVRQRAQRLGPQQDDGTTAAVPLQEQPLQHQLR
jgi:hypothetical protein